MTDIIIEILRAIVVGGIIISLIRVRHAKEINKISGWRTLVVGFVFIFFGTLIDITDNFENLNRFVIIGDTEAQAFLEKIVGYLLGFLLLAIGIRQWLPKLIEHGKLSRNKHKLEVQEERLKILQATQQQLKRSAEKFRDLYESIPLAYFSLDNTRKISECNESAVSLLGYSKEEMLGKSPIELYADTPDGKEKAKQINQKVLAGESVNGEELQMLKADGTVVWVSVTIRPKTEGHSHRAMIEDITERKKAEAQIIAAKQDAELANLAKSRFLSSMSHELRTPLNAILGFGQLLDTSDNPLSEDQRNSVEHILDGGKHLLALINEVLDLARIESGSLELSIEPVAPDSIVEPCLAMAQSMSLNFNVTVENRISVTDLPMVMADLTRGKQVLLNLLSNAMKYNRPEGSVFLDCRKTENNTLRFSVTDTGLGIPEEKFDLLFKPFDRLHNQNNSIEGTGIGLTITKELVEQMDGRIGFESTVGKGSTFWFELPIAEGGVEAGQNEKTSAPAIIATATSTAALNTTKSILYIEDNPANTKLMAAIFQRSPHPTLTTATSAELGLESVAHEKPDLILMDIGLPGMDGFEACGILKNNEPTANIPVIAVSANALNDDIKRAKAAGFVDYITKPFEVSEVLETIAKVLDDNT